MAAHMKLFAIRSYGDDFYTGEARDGRRVLMGLLCPNLVAVFFDAGGEYVSCETQALTLPPARMDAIGALRERDSGTESADGVRPGPFQIYDPAFRAPFDNDLARLKRQIGFIERPIRVQQFHVNAHPAGIDLLPGYLAEFKQDPAEVAKDDEDLNVLQESLDEWESAGNFVLWWGKDYWFGPDGQVLST